MKYVLCAPNDGDTMTVSGGGGFSGDVDRGSAWSGGGNGGDRGTSDNGGNKNDKPVRLFTGGPIIVVRDGLRYVGIIVDENNSNEPMIDWGYDGSNSDNNIREEQSKSPSSLYIEGFGKVSYSDKSEVMEVLNQGGIFVGPGLIRNKNTMLIYANGGICSATVLNGKLVNVAFISRRERFGYNERTRSYAVSVATTRANEYLQAQENLARGNFPSVFTLRGIRPSASPSLPSMQFAIAGGGGASVSDSVQIRLTQLLSEFWATASRIATASAAGPIAAALSLLTYSSKVGVGSDKVPGRNDDIMFSIPVRNLPNFTLPDNMADIASNKGSVNLPIRAAFVEKDGKMSLSLFKTENTHVPASVKVLKGEFDKDTSTFRTDISGIPSRIILESPANAPTVNVGNTASPQPDYKIPTHTGIEVKPVDKLTVTTTPIAEPAEFYDYIIWTPTANGTGVEPIYVVFNDPLDSDRFTRKQLDKKYKHAVDFGINDTKKNSETLTKFRDAIEVHLADKETVEKGTYLHEKESKVLFNPKTNNVVILKKNGDFISGWHLTVGTPQYDIYIKTGNLK